MKKSIDLLFVLLCFAFVIACQPAQEKSHDNDNTEVKTNDDMQDDDKDVLYTVNTISLDTFNDWKRRWKEYDTLYLDSTALEYFNVPLQDLFDVLGEHPHGSRFYMGLEQFGLGDYMPHLMIVATDATGAPIMSSIYDYSSACPPLCNEE